jgi:hypothetical protein
MKVGQEIVELLRAVPRVEIGLCWHEVAAVEDGGSYTLIVGGSATGEVGLLEHAEERWTVQRAGNAVIVALCATGLEDLMAAALLGVELIERCRWRRGPAAEKQGTGSKEKTVDEALSVRQRLRLLMVFPPLDACFYFASFLKVCSARKFWILAWSRIISE